MNKLAFTLSAAALTFVSSTALAQGPEACGGIDFWSVSECHFEFDGGCKAKCEPLRFTAACDGECNASIDASCDTQCTGSCEAACEADPGRFDCRSECFGECTANIALLCDSNDQECISYCEADCSASCETECEVVAPSASCDAQCNACCTGSCDVEANFDCSLDCAASLEGGCEVDCESPEGALFCDGQYIAVQDLPECVAYLIDNFSVNLAFSAEASFDGNLDTNLAMCAMGDSRRSDGGIGLMMLGLGFMFYRRRRDGRKTY